MELEGLTGEEIVKKELDTGVPIIYELDAQGNTHAFSPPPFHSD